MLRPFVVKICYEVFIVDLYIRAGLTVLATFLQQVIGETLADKEDE